LASILPRAGEVIESPISSCLVSATFRNCYYVMLDSSRTFWAWPTMKRTPKTQTSEPSLRDRLASQFIEALEKDWAEHGASVIEAVREKAPAKYAELIARLAPVEPHITGGQGDFSECNSQEDIARKLLRDVGAPDEGITPDMLERAVKLQLAFLSDLERIARGH
jgi:hypothetical protein